MTDNLRILQDDTLRYRKNKLPANLTLLGLLFNILFFCIAYSITVPSLKNNEATWFVTILMGASVILTLVMLLTAFLASEGIKAYKKSYVIVILVLAVIQFARIFVFPLYVFQHEELTRTYFWIRSTTNILLGIMMIVWLCASMACFIAAAVLGYLNCKKLEKHLHLVESGAINIEQLIKNAEDEIVAGSDAADVKEVE